MSKGPVVRANEIETGQVLRSIDTNFYCNRCKTLTRERPYHCDSCDVCIDDYDHHCPWIGKVNPQFTIYNFQTSETYTQNHDCGLLVTKLIQFELFLITNFVNITRDIHFQCRIVQINIGRKISTDLILDFNILTQVRREKQSLSVLRVYRLNSSVFRFHHDRGFNPPHSSWARR